MPARRYPWTVLEIDRTDDVKVIRKAYAAKLKVTRPDEDPKGFQALVEARDRALATAAKQLRQPDIVETLAPPPQAMEPASAAIAAPLPDIADLQPGPQKSMETAENPVETPFFAGASSGHPSIDRHNVIEIAAVPTAEAPPDWAALLRSNERFLKKALSAVSRLGKSDDMVFAAWISVFERVENAPLMGRDRLYTQLLRGLIENLRLEFGEISDLPAPQIKSDPGRHFGVYASVLREFERRFRVLEHDRILLELLPEKEAGDLLAALSFASGRSHNAGPAVQSGGRVPLIDMRYVLAAYAEEPRMIAYYKKALRSDRFPLSFNPIALVLPFFVCVYYRMHGLAVAAAVLPIAYLAFAPDDEHRLSVPFGPSILLIYLFVAMMIAIYWRAARVLMLAQRLRRGVRAGKDHMDLSKIAAVWGAPNWQGVRATCLAISVVLPAFIRWLGALR